MGVTMVGLTCIYCGRAFNRALARHNWDVRHDRPGPFCSKSCSNSGRPYAPRPFDFWSRVDKSGECWVWTGARSSHGYGHFRRGGKTVSAIRWIYEAEVGPIPAGHQIRHACDNPPCVRPDHLSTGTAQDNSNDRVARGRARGRYSRAA